MKKKTRKTGFTLVELMIVVMIVGILAAVAIPLMRGRVDAAKWSEGKAGAGTIATALRAYAAEKGADGTYPPSLDELGFIDSDLHGTFFDINDYAISEAAYVAGSDPELTFTITVSNDDLEPTAMTLSVGADGKAVWGVPSGG